MYAVMQVGGERPVNGCVDSIAGASLLIAFTLMRDIEQTILMPSTAAWWNSWADLITQLCACQSKAPSRGLAWLKDQQSWSFTYNPIHSSLSYDGMIINFHALFKYERSKETSKLGICISRGDY